MKYDHACGKICIVTHNKVTNAFLMSLANIRKIKGKLGAILDFLHSRSLASRTQHMLELLASIFN